jgi:hypothetical protein
VLVRLLVLLQRMERWMGLLIVLVRLFQRLGLVVVLLLLSLRIMRLLLLLQLLFVALVLRDTVGDQDVLGPRCANNLFLFRGVRGGRQ